MATATDEMRSRNTTMEPLSCDRRDHRGALAVFPVRAPLGWLVLTPVVLLLACVWPSPVAGQSCAEPDAPRCSPPSAPDVGLLAAGGTLFGAAYLGALVFDLVGAASHRQGSPGAFEEPIEALPYGAVGVIPFFQAAAGVDGGTGWMLGAVTVGLVAAAVEIVGTVLLILGAMSDARGSPTHGSSRPLQWTF